MKHEPIPFQKEINVEILQISPHSWLVSVNGVECGTRATKGKAKKLAKLVRSWIPNGDYGSTNITTLTQ